MYTTPFEVVYASLSTSMYWSLMTWWPRCGLKQVDFKYLRNRCLKLALGYIERMLLGMKVCTWRKCGVGERGSVVKAVWMIHCSQQLSECACSHSLSLSISASLSGPPLHWHTCLFQPCSTLTASFNNLVFKGKTTSKLMSLAYSSRLSSTKTTEENEWEKECWKWQPWRCSIQGGSVKHPKRP